MKYALMALILFGFTSIGFSQESKTDSTSRQRKDTLIIRESKFVSGISKPNRYDSLFIWSDRRSISEVSSELPGFYVYRFNDFGRNSINFNGTSDKEIGILRDGIQINDIYYGGFDPASISINDIESIEEISAVSSFLYGVTSSAKSLNFVTKDKIQSKPFSQFRFSQDRFNSLFADVFFTLPLTKKYSLTMGVTKHSTDGRYTNTVFDVWNGRMRFNMLLSDKINLRADFYYNDIERGLNEGLQYNEDVNVLEDEDASVNNPYSNESIEQLYFGAAMTGKFFGKNSLTKLNIHSSNSLRNYSNLIIDSSLVNAGFGASETVHYIANLIQLSQEGKLKLSRTLTMNLFGMFSGYQNHYDKPVSYDKERLQFSLKATLDHDYFRFSVFGNNPVSDISFDNLNKGAEVTFFAIRNSSTILSIYGGINETTNPVFAYDPYTVRKSYIEAGAGFELDHQLSISQTFYRSSPSFSENTQFSFQTQSFNGLNTKLSFNAFHFYSDISYGYAESDLFPEHNLVFDLSYRNFLFLKKLNLHTGFRGSYLRRRSVDFVFDQKKNEIVSLTDTFKRDEFNIDFYLGARIGRANVNLTLANLFNSFSYGANLYPQDNRGGFVNVISRFTIAWDFID